jgi:hypothetical protein
LARDCDQLVESGEEGGDDDVAPFLVGVTVNEYIEKLCMRVESDARPKLHEILCTPAIFG